MKVKCCDNQKISDEFLDLAKFLRILGEDNRLKIICLLKRGELCVCEIWQNLDLPQNLISSHLKILREFGLITSRQEGKKIYYATNQKVFKKYNSLLTNFIKKYE